MPQPIWIRRRVILFILLFQPIPLLLFPFKSFSPASQEWWLPVLLALMVVIADGQIILRNSAQLWPWNLMAFAQGFNIISRLMMLWPHATVMVGGTARLDLPYVSLSFLAMLLSAGLLWYLELPEVRQSQLRD